MQVASFMGGRRGETGACACGGRMHAPNASPTNDSAFPAHIPSSCFIVPHLNHTLTSRRSPLQSTPPSTCSRQRRCSALTALGPCTWGWALARPSRQCSGLGWRQVRGHAVDVYLCFVPPCLWDRELHCNCSWEVNTPSMLPSIHLPVQIIVPFCPMCHLHCRHD